MRQYHMYLRNGKVFIPTFGLVHKGLYRDVEPVAVVDVSDTGALRQAFRETIARGNPPTPYYPRDAYPLPVVVVERSLSRLCHGRTPVAAFPRRSFSRLFRYFEFRRAPRLPARGT